MKWLLTCCLLGLVFCEGCSKDAEDGTAGDADSDGDSDADSDGDSDGDTDGDSDPVPGLSCEITAERVRITTVNLGKEVVADEDEARLHPLVISAIPSGGSRLAWMDSDGNVNITTLDETDSVVGGPVVVPAVDYSDMYATGEGGVLLLTRDAEGGGTLNCGDPQNLCFPPDDPVACHDMYMVGFDDSGQTWSTRLTESSSQMPPYSTGPDGDNVVMIWWYAHHGRIASDGANFAAYYGAAISVSEGGCINIHQGDRMDVIDGDGNRVEGGFGWGCSHSGYERLLYDPVAGEYVAVCKNDRPTDGESGKLAFAPGAQTILPVDLWYSEFGDLALGGDGGYWLTLSMRQEGQPANAEGVAEVRLVHFTDGTPDLDLLIDDGGGMNARAPHLATYGSDGLLVAWETSSEAGVLSAWDGERTLHVQARDNENGQSLGEPVVVDGIIGNRYQSFRSFPDGSVAYPSIGDTSDSVKILRVLPCE